jgi:hypothetical protein
VTNGNPMSVIGRGCVESGRGMDEALPGSQVVRASSPKSVGPELPRGRSEVVYAPKVVYSRK